MVFVLTTTHNRGTLDRFAREWARSASRHAVEVPLEGLLGREVLAPGTYVLTAGRQMSPPQRRVVGSYVAQVEGAAGFRVANRDGAAPRLEMYEKLFAAGLSPFRAFRSSCEPEDLRFPVLLRIENESFGPRSKPIPDWETLRIAVRVLVVSGFEPGELLTMETPEDSSATVVRRVLRVGDKIVPLEAWPSSEAAIRTETVDDEKWFLQSSPDERLMLAFELARVEFGEAHHSVEGSEITVWDVTDSPTFLPPEHKVFPKRLPHLQFAADRVSEALRDLDLGTKGGAPVQISHLGADIWGALRGEPAGSKT